ncbi:MAG: WD40/YVTN/BNR-like repeat-containing protein [Acidimicrobiales bacterium]
MATPAGTVRIGTSTGLVDAAGARPVAHRGQDVMAVAGAWAVVNGHEVVAEDGRRAPPVEVSRLACLAHLDVGGGGDRMLAGTADAHLYRVSPRTVERLVSFDDAEGRHRWYTPWGGPPAARSIAVSEGGTVLVNVHVGGILRSTDDCRSWQATIDLDHDVHQVVAGPGFVLAACAAGLAVSDDDGRSWRIVDDGLAATYARAVAVSGETVLLSASTGPLGEQSGVYRRPLNSDQPFERCRAGLPEWFDGNIDTFWLDGRPDGTAAFTTAGGDIFTTADEGVTWEQMATRVPGPRCLALVSSRVR